MRHDVVTIAPADSKTVSRTNSVEKREEPSHSVIGKASPPQPNHINKISGMEASVSTRARIDGSVQTATNPAPGNNRLNPAVLTRGSSAL